MNCAAAFKCDGYKFRSLLAGYSDKGAVCWRGAQYVNAWASVNWKGVYSVGGCTLGVHFFNNLSD